MLALAGIDNMRLNTDEKGEETEYLLSYLPRLRQETFTVGASYRHYAGRHAQTVTLSHSYLNNRNTKYLGNDESSEDNLTLRLRAVEQKTSLRAENRSYLGRWTLREGVELSYSHYTNRTFRRFFAEQAGTLNYRTRLGEIDIIASNRQYLVFCEVKLRKSADFAAAREFVDARKQQRLRTTALLYLSQHETPLQPRFDVIEIYAPDGTQTRRPQITHMEDAF